jgi:hypothetical protein
METKIDASLATSECTKSYSNLTETVYTNICTGKVTEVPYGTLDYIGGFLITIFVVCVFAFFGTLTFKILTD